MYLRSLRSPRWCFSYAMRNTLRRFFSESFFVRKNVVLFKYAYPVFIVTLVPFSAYQFDRQLVFF